jgi:tetratricopeptide (TPR) repeat protein/predicted Ser/Thr protein kinase
MKQSAQTFLKVEIIVNDLLDAPATQREDLLASQCGGDTALAGAVRSMLEAVEAETRLTALCRSVADEKQPGRPRRIGPYELDSLLGRGGMGAVYLAHRADGQFEQKLAIKLADLPLATELFRERFRQERQILAGLQHPYIARLLDGGVTAEGELYLAMEYVDGVPIQRFCEANKLSERQRIELFLRVCEAVQFAHRNLVVHRDLKPDNILIAADGTPRLLDFGTAKLLSPARGETASELTREAYLAFTPQYASPEQVLGKPITTASDTYSLGVLLYLLLTGSPPYELKELTTGEILQKVCEEAPRKPAHPAGANRRFDADLEAVLMKALRKEPLERYLTPEHLSSDLCAYLEGRPVAARRGTRRYRMGKFIRRHRIGLAALAVVAVSLCGGVTGVLWQTRVANQERHRAEARSADLRQLSNSLLTELDEAIQQIPGSTAAQKLLVTRVLEHLDRMAQDAKGDRQTQLDLVDAYTRLANLQGNTYSQNLGDSAGAQASIDKAIAIGVGLVRNNAKDREALAALALAHLSRSQILSTVAPMPHAVAAARAAIAAYEQVIIHPAVQPVQLMDAARAYAMLADELGSGTNTGLHDVAGTLAVARKAGDLVNRALRIDPNFAGGRYRLATVQVRLVRVEIESNPAQAVRDAALGLDYLAAQPPQERGALKSIRVGEALDELKAWALAQLGRYAEANEAAARSVHACQRLAAADPKDLRAQDDLMLALGIEAECLKSAGDPDLGATASDRRRSMTVAEKVLAQILSVLEGMLKLQASSSRWKPLLADAQVSLGSTRYHLRGGDDAADLARRGLATLREMSKSDWDSEETLGTTAMDFLTAEPASLRDPAFAVSCAERAADLSHHAAPSTLLTLAQAYRAAGQIDKSRAVAKEGLALMAPVQPGDPKPRTRRLLELQTR